MLNNKYSLTHYIADRDLGMLAIGRNRIEYLLKYYYKFKPDLSPIQYKI
jgi:hypothetical protein